MAFARAEDSPCGGPTLPVDNKAIHDRMLPMLSALHAAGKTTPVKTLVEQLARKSHPLDRMVIKDCVGVEALRRLVEPEQAGQVSRPSRRPTLTRGLCGRLRADRGLEEPQTVAEEASDVGGVAVGAAEEVASEDPGGRVSK